MRCVVVPEGGSATTKQSYAQILAVHAALLQNGKILFFSGDQHDPGRNAIGDFDSARLFDCNTLTVTTPAAASFIKDLFCCGHAFLPDGRLLVGGGTQAWTTEEIGGADPHGHAGAGHFRGTVECFTFDPATNQWHVAANMVPEPGRSVGGGRWYPTLLTIGSGHILALSGHPSDADSRHFNDTVETYAATSSTGAWSDLGTLPAVMGGYPGLTYYPRGHLLKNGKVFFSSSINGQSMTWDTVTHLWAPVCAGLPEAAYSNGISANSVLLPLLSDDNYRQRVLVCGEVVARRIDLDAPMTTWQPTASRTLTIGGTIPTRNHCNSVLLPTGEVALVGGMGNPGDDPGSAVLPIEIYRYATDTWVTLPAAANASIARNYHSVALLMPDGRVWMAGSNIRASWSFHEPASYPPPSLPTNAQDPGVDNRRLQIELFEPWYFGRPDRPTYTKSKVQVSVGGSFTIDTPRAPSISRVAVIRCGSSTHSFNPDQRYVGLPYTRSGNTLTISVPDNENLLPPGYYLLFVLDQVVDPTTSAILDVPSVGQFLRIDNAKTGKELKWEIKEFKLELKEHLKQEVDIPKLEFIENRPKSLKDMVELDPFERWREVVDPAQLLPQLAQQLDNLNREAAKGRAFIKSEERPPVGRSQVRANPMLERTPPPTAEELARLDEHGRHEGRPGTIEGHTDEHSHTMEKGKTVILPKSKGGKGKKRGK